MSMSKILSICIPVFNKFEFTKSCLIDLEKLPKDHEIIIVDNGSTDKTQSYLANSKNIVYIRNNTNEGFAKACNKAYANSSAPNVLFLNNDIRVKSNYDNWTKPLLDHCDTGLVGPTMGQLDSDLNFVQEANKVLPGNSYMSGWCLASSKKIWSKLDISGNNEIFSEEFFCYFEDTDLSFRAKKHGIPFIVQDIPVVHFGRVSSKQLNTHQLYTKARQIFVKKWG
jgi:GT2 family glycosyltransferase